MKSICCALIPIALAVSGTALAAQPAPQCAQPAIAAPWLGWSRTPAPLARGGTVKPGQPYSLSLFEPAPDLPFEGSFDFVVRAAGTFRFALGSDAWIDLVSGNEVLKPKSQGHGPQCSGIRKIIDYDLAPGHYSVRITKSATATVTVLAIGV